MNSSTLSKELLSVFILWLCPAFWLQDMTMYLVLSAFTSSPVSLIVTTKACVIFSTVCTLPSNILTHLCLTFHYWNGCDVGVIYILLLKVITEPDFFFFYTCLPPEGTRYHVVHRVSHCCRSCRAGSLLKKWCKFSINFLTTIHWQVNTTLLHYLLY
jgi:hypothetical protein